MCLYQRTKFQVSVIILTRFREGAVLTPLPPTSKQTPKGPTQIKDPPRVKDCLPQILLGPFLNTVFQIPVKV